MACMDQKTEEKSCDLSGEWESFIERADLADGYKYTPKEAAKVLGIYTKKRPTETALKRFLFWYYVRQRAPKLSFREIGLMTGGQDHSAVLHGVNYARDPERRKRYLSEFDAEVFRVILKTDLYHDSKKRESV